MFVIAFIVFIAGVTMIGVLAGFAMIYVGAATWWPALLAIPIIGWYLFRPAKNKQVAPPAMRRGTGTPWGGGRNSLD